MGGTYSSYYDEYKHIENDYELVIRVSKGLDRELKQGFGIDCDGLSEKITKLQTTYSCYLSQETISNMRRLVNWRNRLVHEFDVDDLSDLGTNRHEFRRRYSKAKEELERCKARQTDSTQLTTNRLSNTTTNDQTDSGVGTALMLGGALLAGLVAVAASSGESRCLRCNRRVGDDQRYCFSCNHS